MPLKSVSVKLVSPKHGKHVQSTATILVILEEFIPYDIYSRDGLDRLKSREGTLLIEIGNKENIFSWATKNNLDKNKKPILKNQGHNGDPNKFKGQVLYLGPAGSKKESKSFFNQLLLKVDVIETDGHGRKTLSDFKGLLEILSSAAAFDPVHGTAISAGLGLASSLTEFVRQTMDDDIEIKYEGSLCGKLPPKPDLSGVMLGEYTIQRTCQKDNSPNMLIKFNVHHVENFTFTAETDDPSLDCEDPLDKKGPSVGMIAAGMKRYVDFKETESKNQLKRNIHPTVEVILKDIKIDSEKALKKEKLIIEIAVGGGDGSLPLSYELDRPGRKTGFIEVGGIQNRLLYQGQYKSGLPFVISIVGSTKKSSDALKEASKKIIAETGKFAKKIFDKENENIDKATELAESIRSLAMEFDPSKTSIGKVSGAIFNSKMLPKQVHDKTKNNKLIIVLPEDETNKWYEKEITIESASGKAIVTFCIRETRI
jgi:hypothetical protein